MWFTVLKHILINHEKPEIVPLGYLACLYSSGIAANTCLGIFEGGQNMPVRHNYKIAVFVFNIFTGPFLYSFSPSLL